MVKHFNFKWWFVSNRLCYCAVFDCPFTAYTAFKVCFNAFFTACSRLFGYLFVIMACGFSYNFFCLRFSVTTRRIFQCNGVTAFNIALCVFNITVVCASCSLCRNINPVMGVICRSKCAGRKHWQHHTHRENTSQNFLLHLRFSFYYFRRTSYRYLYDSKNS